MHLKPKLAISPNSRHIFICGSDIEKKNSVRREQVAEREKEQLTFTKRKISQTEAMKNYL